MARNRDMPVPQSYKHLRVVPEEILKLFGHVSTATCSDTITDMLPAPCSHTKEEGKNNGDLKDAAQSFPR